MEEKYESFEKKVEDLIKNINLIKEKNDNNCNIKTIIDNLEDDWKKFFKDIIYRFKQRYLKDPKKSIIGSDIVALLLDNDISLYHLLNLSFEDDLYKEDTNLTCAYEDYMIKHPVLTKEEKEQTTFDKRNKQECSQLSNNVEEQKTTSNNIEILKNKIETINEEISEISSQIKSLKTKSRFDSQISQEDINNLEAKKIKLKQQRTNIELNLQSIESNNNQNITQISDNQAIAANKILTRKNKELLEQIDILKEEKEKLENKLNNSSNIPVNKYIELKKLYDEANKALKDCEKELDKVQTELRNSKEINEEIRVSEISSDIEDEIIKKIYSSDEGISIDDIKFIKGRNISITAMDNIMKKIGKLINIHSSIGLDGQKHYFLSEKNHLYGNPNSYISILAIADRHFQVNTSFSAMQKKNDTLYEYCANNNIQTILNLGDTYNFLTPDQKTAHPELYLEQYGNGNDFMQEYNLIKNFAKSLPQNTNISYNDFFGNHEKQAEQKGINIIGIMTENAPNYHFIGREKEKIYINKTPIGLYHKKFENLPFQLMQKDLNSFLSTIEEQVKKDDNAMNLIAHFHHSFLNNEEKLLFFDKNKPIRLDFHIAEDGTIDYVFLKMLTFSKKDKVSYLEQEGFERIRLVLKK